jgi:hypothetical protein
MTEKTEWVILSTTGAFRVAGKSATAAIKRYSARTPCPGEVIGVFLAGMVQEKPLPSDPIPFRCVVFGAVAQKPKLSQEAPKP